jgi:hypothetical protein
MRYVWEKYKLKLAIAGGSRRAATVLEHQRMLQQYLHGKRLPDLTNAFITRSTNPLNEPKFQPTH